MEVIRVQFITCGKYGDFANGEYGAIKSRHLGVILADLVQEEGKAVGK